jgi:hypothetical protein
MTRARLLGLLIPAVPVVGISVIVAAPGCMGETSPEAGFEARRSALTPTVNWLQSGGDSVHSFNNTTENALSSVNVSALSELFSVPGATPPLVANGKVYVVNFARTQILSYDARSGVAGPVSPVMPAGSEFTGRETYIPTPGIDPGMAAIYMPAKDGFVHKFDLPALTENTSGWGAGATKAQFSKKFSSEPAATPVTISGGFLYLGAGDCDSLNGQGDCQGHVKAISLTTSTSNAFNMICTSLSPSLIAANGCANTGGAVWNRAGIVFDPLTQHLYAQTANATLTTSGGVQAGFFTNSVVQLDSTAVGTAQKKPLDSYTPNPTPNDLGGTSVTVLNNVSGATSFPHLLMVSGHKDSYLRLVNADNMSSHAGGPQAGNVGGELTSFGPLDWGDSTFLWSSTATWVNPADQKTWIFVPLQRGYGSGADLSVMYGFTVNPADPNQGNKPSLTQMWRRPSTTKGGGGVVANGVLYYHDGTDLLAVNATTGNMSGSTVQAPLWCSAGINGAGCNTGMASNNHKGAPVVANSVLYYATRDGTLKAFGFKPNNPAIATRGVNQLEVFQTTAAGGVAVRTFNNGWDNWAVLPTLPSPAASGPGAVSWDSTRTDVFVRGANGRLYHNWRNTGGWSATWEPLDCCIDGAPTVSTWGANRLDIFAAQSGALWHKWYQGGWYGPELLFSGTLIVATPPAAVSWGPNRIDIVARGPNGDINQVAYANGWYGPFSLGGATVDAGTRAGVSTWGVNRLDVFAVVGGQVKLRTFNNGWAPTWVDVLPGIAKTGVSAVSWGTNRIDIVTSDANGIVNQGASNSPPTFSGWWGL